MRQNEENKWSWKGVWTFGNLPDDEEEALNAKNPTCRPFVYTWEEARSASDVLVPSANATTTEKKVSEETATPKETEDNKVGVDGGVKPMEVEASESMREEQKEETVQKPQEESKSEPKTSVEETMEQPVDESNTKSVEKKDGADVPKEKGDDDKLEVLAENEENLAKKEAVTFATTSPDEPPFTDAATKHPEKCPLGGAWKGYFETASVSARARVIHCTS